MLSGHLLDVPQGSYYTEGRAPPAATHPGSRAAMIVAAALGFLAAALLLQPPAPAAASYRAAPNPTMRVAAPAVAVASGRPMASRDATARFYPSTGATVLEETVTDNRAVGLGALVVPLGGLLGVVVGVAAAWVTRRRSNAEAPAPPLPVAMFATTGQFTLPPLPWERTALAPHISAETIDYHYGKHHQAYVTKLNELVGTPEHAQWRGKSLEEIVLGSTGIVFNQAAQIWNHTFYWEGLRPNPEGRPNPPTGPVAALIDRDFGSTAAFQEQFTAQAVGHFGSGWVWLVQGPDGKLRITQGHDAANPVRDGTGTPLLTCDVWEHAYYVDQRIARPAYVKAWWNLVNWDFVNRNVSKA
jgi:Fe-Mn family superoxide dismutase